MKKVCSQLKSEEWHVFSIGRFCFVFFNTEIDLLKLNQTRLVMVYQEQVFSQNAASTVVVKTADAYLFFYVCARKEAAHVQSCTVVQFQTAVLAGCRHSKTQHQKRAANLDGHTVQPRIVFVFCVSVRLSTYTQTLVKSFKNKRTEKQYAC